MSKAVLISIQPKWCELILRGKKTIEVRKSRPKIETPFKCYIYCTLQGSNEFFRNTLNGSISKWNKKNWGLKKGKVIGEFVCDKINKFSYDEKFDNITLTSMSIKACLRKSEIEDYANGQYMIYGWHISDLVIYDKPKELSEFHKPCIYAKLGECIGRQCDKALFTRAGLFDNCENILLKPPQSWCYVEECGNNA